MERWDQYEVWVDNQGTWEMLAWFRDPNVASAVFRNRTYRQRLVHAVYEDGKVVQQDVVAELGATRQEP
jgi:hypothetical protein